MLYKKNHFAFVSCAIALLIFSIAIIDNHASAQVSAIPWQDGWSANGPVHAIEPSSDAVYIGGAFTYVGQQTGNLVRLDGTTHLFDRFFPKVQGIVYAAVPDGKGGWYFGGAFSVAGGERHAGLAHMDADGILYTDPLPGVNVQGGEAIYALALSADGQMLFIGGKFEAIGGVNRRNLAALNTATGAVHVWQPDPDGFVRVFAQSHDKKLLYVGGNFEASKLERNQPYLFSVHADPASANFGALTTWDPEADGAVETLFYTKAIDGEFEEPEDPDNAEDQYVLYVGGWFSTLGNSHKSFLGAVDADTAVARNWNPAPDNPVFALAVDDKTVYAGGSFNRIGFRKCSFLGAVDRVSGQVPDSWLLREDTEKLNGWVTALALSTTPDLLYAGGHFTRIGSKVRARLAKINCDSESSTYGAPTGWDPGAGDITYVLSPYVDPVAGEEKVLVAGKATEVNGKIRHRLAAFDKGATPGPDYVLNDWNPHANNPVYALAVSEGDAVVYAGGIFTSMGDAGNPEVYAQERKRLAAIHGDRGTNYGKLIDAWTPEADRTVYALSYTDALALSPKLLYMGGAFTKIDEQVRPGLAAVNASAGDADYGSLINWQPGLPAVYYALALSDDNDFIFAGGEEADYDGLVACINTGGSPVWTLEADLAVRSLASAPGDVLYAGGFFNEIKNASNVHTCMHLARIDDSVANGIVRTDWTPGVNGPVYSLLPAFHGVYLAAGGNFSHSVPQAQEEALLLGNLAVIQSDPVLPEFGQFFSLLPKADQPVYVLTHDSIKPFLFAGGAFSSMSVDGMHYYLANALAIFLMNDVTPPVITLKGDAALTLECGTVYTELGATALDDWDGNISYALIIDATAVDTSVPGDYKVIYSVQDSAGNASTEERDVKVQDTIAPEITLLGDAEIRLQCNADTFVDPGAVVVDSCDGVIPYVVNGNLDLSQPGVYQLFYEAVSGDTAGNTVGPLTRTVIVEDTYPPVFEMTELPVINIETGQTFTDQIPFAFDQCRGVVPVTSDAAAVVRADQPGVYTVTYTASDGQNTATITRTVYVTALDKPHVGAVTVPSTSSILVVFSRPMSSQALMPAYYTLSGPGRGSFGAHPDRVLKDPSEPGAYILEWNSPAEMLDGGSLILTVNPLMTDADGNLLDEPKFGSAVGKGLPPTITVLGNNPETIECGVAYSDAGATAFDVPAGTIQVTVTGLDALVGAPTGTYEVVYQATDPAGNTSIEKRQIVVEDTEAPTLTLVGDAEMTINCGTAFADPGATAEDDCEGTLTSQVTVSYFYENGNPVDTLNGAAPGIYRAHYNVSDSAANKAQAVERKIVVKSAFYLYIGSVFTEPPVFQNGFQVWECSRDFIEPVDFQASDLCTGDLGRPNSGLQPGEAGVKAFAWALDAAKQPVVQNGIPLVYSADAYIRHPGDYLLFYVAYDAHGDSYPTLNALGAPTLPSPLYLDAQLEVLAIDYGRLVRIVDSVAPQISLGSTDPMVLECGTLFQDSVYAFDDCNGDISSLVTASGTVNISVPGSYTIAYTVTDSSGNAAVPVWRTVSVVDTAPPEILLNGPATLQVDCGSSFSSPVTAIDACDGDLTAALTVTGTVNTNIPGTYTLGYTVADSSGNAAVPTYLTVIVSDMTPPVLSVNGPDSILIECHDSYSFDVTAFDNCDGDLTSTITVSGFVNVGVPGNYQLTYAVTDSAGNAAVPRICMVKVQDHELPVIHLNGPDTVIVQCGVTWTDPVTATDSCAGDLTAMIQALPVVDTAIPGIFNITYTVADPSGNTDMATRTVIVEDTIPPVIHAGSNYGPTAEIVGGFLKWYQGNTFVEPSDFTVFDACEGVFSAIAPLMPPSTAPLIAYAWALDPFTKEPLWNTPMTVPLWYSYDDFVNHPGYYLVVYEAQDSTGNHTPPPGVGGFVPIFDGSFLPNFLEAGGDLRADITFARLVWVTMNKMDELPFDFASWVWGSFGTWDANGDSLLDKSEQEEALNAYADAHPGVAAGELLFIAGQLAENQMLTAALLEDFIRKHEAPCDPDETAPVVFTDAITLSLGEDGTVSLFDETQPYGTAAVRYLTDNCSSFEKGELTITAEPDLFDCANLGANTVILSVTDQAGGKTEKTLQVVVEDPAHFCASPTEGESVVEGETQPEGEVQPEGEIVTEGETQSEGEIDQPEDEDAAVGCCRSTESRAYDVRQLFGDWLLLGLSVMALLLLAGVGRGKS